MKEENKTIQILAFLHPQFQANATTKAKQEFNALAQSEGVADQYKFTGDD